MLQWLRARSRNRRKTGEIYGAVVAAARQPAYYSQMRVPDTPEGRFEMVALTLFLVLEPLKSAGAGGQGLAQGVIEAFVTDMDDCMREMGVGDLTVPKKVKRAAAAFYERAGVYRDALAMPDEAALGAALARFVYQGRESAVATEFATRTRRVFENLDRNRERISEPEFLRSLLLNEEDENA
jgi:cytochrome b pre-mRNA-processing protein 3